MKRRIILGLFLLCPFLADAGKGSLTRSSKVTLSPAQREIIARAEFLRTHIFASQNRDSIDWPSVLTIAASQNIDLKSFQFLLLRSLLSSATIPMDLSLAISALKREEQDVLRGVLRNMQQRDFPVSYSVDQGESIASVCGLESVELPFALTRMLGMSLAPDINNPGHVVCKMGSCWPGEIVFVSAPALALPPS